ncbi:hypothetical protein [Aurantiacibacter sp. MUD61]|uniref:hypothetical protein n=1 Tax=Aurantiacibacter sp. MUD61 TaxID=3009083 RepID=UPI0022F0C7F3|nr:hypothetical protein [Aurantiacibacter sp. MUD61]
MLRLTILLAAAISTTSCASRIELPGSVLPPEQEAAAVEGMGAPEPWRSVDATTGQIADAEGLIQLAEDFPDSASVRLRLLGNAYRDDRPDDVLQHWYWLMDRNYSLGHQTVVQLSAYLASKGEQYTEGVGDDLRIAHEATLDLLRESSELITAVPETIRLPEAVLRNESNGRTLVTSIVSRGLFVQDGGANWREIAIADAGSLAGIALDEPRGLIWIGSGVVDQTPNPETAFRGIIALDRITLEERRRVPAPDGVSISDIAVGPDGTVYGSDPVGGGVYMAALGDNAMQTFIAPGTFRSPQGIAVRPDNTALYISDYRYGLAQVMIRSRVAYRMRAAEPMLLDGVDGLWLRGNELIAVQNGLDPQRVTAFELGQGIGVIASQRTLEYGNPDWKETLGGAIAGNSLYYIGSGQWAVYEGGGVFIEGSVVEPAQIRRLQLVETPPE